MHERREDGLEKQLQMLKERVEFKDEELRDVNELVETLRSDRSKLQTSITRIKHDYSMLDCEKGSTENSLQQLQSDHKRVKKEKERLLLEKDGLHEERGEMNEKMKKLSNECTQW